MLVEVVGKYSFQDGLENFARDGKSPDHGKPDEEVTGQTCGPCDIPPDLDQSRLRSELSF